MATKKYLPVAHEASPNLSPDTGPLGCEIINSTARLRADVMGSSEYEKGGKTCLDLNNSEAYAKFTFHIPELDLPQWGGKIRLSPWWNIQGGYEFSFFHGPTGLDYQTGLEVYLSLTAQAHMKTQKTVPLTYPLYPMPQILETRKCHAADPEVYICWEKIDHKLTAPLLPYLIVPAGMAMLEVTAELHARGTAAGSGSYVNYVKIDLWSTTHLESGFQFVNSICNATVELNYDVLEYWPEIDTVEVVDMVRLTYEKGKMVVHKWDKDK